MNFSLKTFKKALHSHRGKILSGQIAFRYVNSALLTRDIISSPLDSRYSYSRGYRFNFPGSFPALYMAFSDFVCTLEAGQRPDPLATIFENYEREPGIIYSIKVSGNFVNLVDKKSLGQLCLNVNHPEYLIATNEWENRAARGRPTITHKIGQAVYDAGFDGIIYYSYPAFELRHIYNPDMISSICVFMSKDKPKLPEGKTCYLEVFEKSKFTKKLIR